MQNYGAYIDAGNAPKRAKSSEGYYVDPVLGAMPQNRPAGFTSTAQVLQQGPQPSYYPQRYQYHQDPFVPAMPPMLDDPRQLAQMRYAQPHPAQLQYGGGPLDGFYMAQQDMPPQMSSVFPRDEIARSRAAAAATADAPYPYIGGEDYEQLQASVDSSTKSIESEPAAPSRRKRSRVPSPEHVSQNWTVEDDAFGRQTIVTVKPGLTINAEELVGMTPQEVEDYLQPLQLSEEQEAHVKRQRRLLKNRESAQVSRIKKKRYVEELEDRVQELSNKTEALLAKFSKLQQENEELSKELETYRAGGVPVVARDVEGGKPVPPLGRTSASVASGENKMTQVYLLVILFAFGLFISSPDSQQSMIFPHREFTTFTKLPLTDPYVVRRLQSLSYLADNLAQMNVSMADRGGSSPRKHGVYVHCSPSNIESSGDQLSLDTLRDLAANPEKAQSALSIVYALSQEDASANGKAKSHQKEQKVEVTCSVVNSKLYVR